MKKDKKRHKNSFYKIIRCVVLITIIIVFVVIFNINHISIKGDIKDIDDQRSTLWQILISLAVALLGSLITTYVFLTQSLDRWMDEKPYYSEVIQTYRNKVMHRLWCYMIGVFGLMAVIIFLYFNLYFYMFRANKCLKISILLFYIGLMIYTGYFLDKCIDIPSGLSKTVKKMLIKKQQQIKNMIDDDYKRIILSLRQNIKENSLVTWLQLGVENENDRIDRKQFINRFSGWEKLLFSLIETDREFHNKQSIVEQICIAVQDGEDFFYTDRKDNIEYQDAKAYNWIGKAYDKIRRQQNILERKIDGGRFAYIYKLLSDYRDCLQVQIEIGNRKEEGLLKGVDGESDVLAQLSFIFLMYLSTKIFCILPKIEVFTPAGKYEFANFYNVRFENSSFRSSLFKNGVFARSKINNSNFNTSSFEDCEFFSADSRDCSLSNTLFKNCNFRETIFEYVDFTGASIQNCILERTTFNDSILVNVEIKGIQLKQVSFKNCRLWNIRIDDVANQALESCCFDDCDMHNVQFIFVHHGMVLDRKRKLYGNSDLKLVLDFDLEVWFWMGHEKPRFDDIRKKINDYEMKAEQFNLQKTRKENRKQKSINPQSIWHTLKYITEINMRESVFKDTMMPEFSFYRVNLEQSVFVNAQMRRAQMIGVHMPGSIMNNVNMRESLLYAVNMESAVLDEGIFFQAFCKLVNLEDASLQMLHASETKLSFCSFSRSDCTKIDLTKAEIFDSVFQDSILTHAELTHALFKRVNFENSIADHMLSSYSSFKDCIFVNAWIGQSNLNYTCFQNCDFSLADFSQGTVTNAEFHECDFHESNFRGTCFINVCFENSYNIAPQIFAQGKFISCQFKGTDIKLKQIFEKDSKIEIL